MCAIVDTNVVAQMFEPTRTAAGTAFRERVESGLPLVAGGDLLRELDGNTSFRKWRQVAVHFGVFREEPEDQVGERTEKLRDGKLCASDDEHVVAVAQVSGARLLFTNDALLQRDFKNKHLVDAPRGKVYAPLPHRDLSTHHKRLLSTATCITSLARHGPPKPV